MFKVMIVDDESIIRKGLINLVNWNAIDCEIVYGACNGIDARDNLEALNPDIVITDVKMPRMNGIELAEYIHNKHPNIKIIILTAYADFSFAQAAIKYNVVDFVIKSTGPLENIQEAVDKAKKLIFEQREKENEVIKNIGELKEKFLQDIINGVISDSMIIKDRMEKLEIKLFNYYALIFEINHSSLDTYLPDEQTQFYLSLKNFLSLAYKDYQYNIVSTSNKSFCMLLQSNIDYTTDYIAPLNAICKEITSMVDSFMSFKINIGISDIHKSPEEIPAAYNEALKALTSYFYHDNQSVFLYGSVTDKLAESIIESEYFDRIIQSINLGESENAKLILNEFLKKQISIKQPVERIKNIGLTLYALCSKFLANLNPKPSDIINSSNEIYNGILNSKSIAQLTEILNCLVDSSFSYLSSTEKQSNYLINKAMNYIRENYKNEISLQQVADYIHVNSSYLSRLFSKKTGNTFTDAINKLRIEKAKDLLLNTDFKTFEIANAVGILDSTYFIRLFKKYVGYNPQDFRQLNAKNSL